MGECPICGREMFKGRFVDDHHLIPKAKKGRYGTKITIHRVCHDKIHSLWKESELANYYNTADRIKEHPEIQKFIKWLARKPADFYIKTKMANGRRR